MNGRELIEFALTYTNEIKQAVKDKRDDPNIPKTGVGGHCRISDPTATMAIRYVDDLESVDVYYGEFVCGEQKKKHLRRPVAWIDVAYATRRHFGYSLQGEIIERHFKYPQPKRIEICKDLKIGLTYYNMMLKEILCFAYGYAMGKGLFFSQKQ